MFLHLTKKTYEYSRFEKIVDGLSAVLVIAMFTFVAIKIATVPDQVPTHFSLSGTPDSFGGKYSLYILPIIGLVMSAIFYAAKQDPRFLNFPVAVTEENAHKILPVAKKAAAMVQALTLLLFAFLVYSTVDIANESGGRLVMFPLFTYLALLALGLPLAVIRMNRLARKAD